MIGYERQTRSRELIAQAGEPNVLLPNQELAFRWNLNAPSGSDGRLYAYT
jgi:hypothetical protein